VNHKSIEVFERIRNGILCPSVFEFWIDHDSECRVVSMAYLRDGDPIFVHSSSETSIDFSKCVLPQGKEFQGTEVSLDLLFSSLNSTEFLVCRDKYLMCCKSEDLSDLVHINQPFSCRFGEAKDTSQLTGLLCEFAEAVKCAVIQFSTITEMMSRGRFFVACVKHTDTIASCVYVTNPTMSVSRISYVFTQGPYRRKGLSKLLVSTATKWALGAADACTLFVDCANQAALSTYKSVGFEVVAKHQVRQKV
jgi:predicted GNAT family acetyltransferase